MHILLGVIACFVLSGFAALLYQTAWMRQFSLVFGTSELAIAAVLAAYMGGLAVGSAIAAKLVDRIRRPDPVLWRNQRQDRRAQEEIGAQDRLG